ncbi:MAG: pyridoxamine 5'-phosphate oxidase family protein [Planctomycetes bacterium]|nr:pyridoxamine 5'-phosphate oxidase family protein [Planctomycetota bacterium]
MTERGARAPGVRRFVDTIRTMTLACADADGPWAADVCFARVGAGFCFLSSPDSRHARAYAADPRAAATIHGDFARWEEIRGVQIAGRVGEVTGAGAKARAMAAYFRKFPFARGLVEGAAAVLAGRFRLYRLDPEKILLVDNQSGFGARPVTGWTGC